MDSPDRLPTAGSGWLNQRRAVLTVLAIESIALWPAGVLVLSGTQSSQLLGPAILVAAPAMSVLLVLYWRGWEPARYVAICVTVLAVGARLPLPTEAFSYVPHAAVVPSAIAVVLGGPGWVIGSGIAVYAIYAARIGGLTEYFTPAHLFAGVMTVGCLAVARLVVDAARREAESRATQAERARADLARQAAQLEERTRLLEAQAEDLRIAEARNRALLDAIPDSLYRLDREGRVLQRRAPDDGRIRLHTVYEGRTLDELLNSEIGVRLRAAIAQTLATGRPTVVEYTWVRPETTTHREARIVPLHDDQVLALIRDIGERKEAERQRELFERGERLRMLGQMTGGIAHDLNQALAVVTGYVELAREQADDGPNGADLREYLDTATQAAMQGAETVKRLLAFARQRELGPSEIVHLDGVIRDTVRFTAPQWRDRTQAEERPVTLEVGPESGLLVRGWATSLREILMNLVLNAVDALPEGGRIRVGASRDGDYAVLAVADSGVGMPPDVRARAFEPFFTTKGEHGTGLGLAMVGAIVERHDGSIEVASEPGHGTTFTIRLPAISGAAEASRYPSTPYDVTLPGRVLVVDDEPRVARMLAAMLSHDNHDVVTAPSGEAAILLMERSGFDLVVSDLSMGEGMNGWDLARHVAERHPDTRFVLASGWGASIGEQEVRRGSVAAVLAKPYRLDEVRSLVAALTTN